VKHLLVTNDFPPKHGGIQSYLWELWRRLPADEVTVLTTPHPGASEWDREQPFRVVRSSSRVLLPTPAVAAEVRSLAAEVGAELVVLDPALPLGLIGPSLGLPYGIVLHGAEVTAPGRVAGFRSVLRRVLLGAEVVVAAGGYPADEGELAARRGLPVTVVPPGVDSDRFRPLDAAEKERARRRFGLPVDQPLVLGVSRLVPRKGMDVLVRAAAQLRSTHPEVVVAIGGDGRDRTRLERLATELAAPVRFLGRVPEDDLPTLYGSADVFAMLCRNRWLGLEQEGFGIVFLEAAASGVPQVAGRSGGAHEAVEHGSSGLVVDPTDVGQVVAALARLLDDPDERAAMAAAGRERARTQFGYDHLAAELHTALQLGPSR
jgi:phosphatidylinositol alpha-1,6-mannosyltransferase